MPALPPAVTFDYNAWVARYPEFAAVLQPMAQAYFDEAGLYCANSASNPAFADGVLPTLLNMLTAHIAWLNAPRDANGNPSSTGQPASPIVGRINSASEGSVSVQAELESSGSPSEAFFTQTKYGLAYWQATAGYRTMRYSASPTIVVDAAWPFFPGAQRWR